MCASTAMKLCWIQCGLAHDLEKYSLPEVTGLLALLVFIGYASAAWWKLQSTPVDRSHSFTSYSILGTSVAQIHPAEHFCLEFIRSVGQRYLKISTRQTIPNTAQNVPWWTWLKRSGWFMHYLETMFMQCSWLISRSTVKRVAVFLEAFHLHSLLKTPNFPSIYATAFSITGRAFYLANWKKAASVLLMPKYILQVSEAKLKGQEL